MRRETGGLFVVGTLIEFISFIFISIAVSLDGFSVCLGLGMQNLRLRRIAIIGLLIGSFHMVLPFIGLLIGNAMSLKWTNIASFVGGALLTFLGLYMIFSTFQIKSLPPISPQGIQLLMLAFFVSVDSFPVGISLGLSGVRTFFLIIMFGFFTTIFAWTGLLIGKKTSQLFGTYSEIIGGIILFSFGSIYVFDSFMTLQI